MLQNKKLRNATVSEEKMKVFRISYRVDFDIEVQPGTSNYDVRIAALDEVGSHMDDFSLTVREIS